MILIAWPSTPLAELLTSTHHIWFVPLLLVCLHKVRSIDYAVCCAVCCCFSSPLLCSKEKGEYTRTMGGKKGRECMDERRGRRKWRMT